MLRREMFGKYPQPVILDSHSGRLWIDRYYVAYQLSGCPEVKYVYAAKHHILEETAAYRTAAKRGNSMYTMPEEIARQFSIIRQKMRASGTDIWVDHDEDSQGINTKRAV